MKMQEDEVRDLNLVLCSKLALKWFQLLEQKGWGKGSDERLWRIEMCNKQFEHCLKEHFSRTCKNGPRSVSEARRDCKTCCRRKQDGIVVSECFQSG
jgi:hypothetical protein